MNGIEGVIGECAVFIVACFGLIIGAFYLYSDGKRGN